MKYSKWMNNIQEELARIIVMLISWLLGLPSDYYYKELMLQLRIIVLFGKEISTDIHFLIFFSLKLLLVRSDRIFFFRKPSPLWSPWRLKYIQTNKSFFSNGAYKDSRIIHFNKYKFLDHLFKEDCILLFSFLVLSLC